MKKSNIIAGQQKINSKEKVKMNTCSKIYIK